MKSLLVRSGVILIGLSILNYAEGWGADWRYFSTGNEGMLYWYDALRVTHQPNKVIQVWIKKVKADESLVKGDAKLLPSELEQIASGKDYEQSLIELDCTEKTFNILQKLNYDSKGVLKSGESKPVGMKPIQKNSNAERLYKAVCK